MSETASVKWNSDVCLAISDVDETIADVNAPAEPEMIVELSSYLEDGGKLFMVTGGSLNRVKTGITDSLNPALRQQILVAHCSGSEVWGFEASGELRPKPFYSLYEAAFTAEMKQSWRLVTTQLLAEFQLRPHPIQTKSDFWQQVGRHPLDIMVDDRGPQITFTLPNGRDIAENERALFRQAIPVTNGRHDLRIPIVTRAEALLAEAQLPIYPCLGGNYSIDFAVVGASKATAIQTVLARADLLQTIGLTVEDVQHPEHLEVWGDKFSVIDGGTDRHISEALPPSLRSIDFRQEDPAELPTGYNIVLWDGEHRLHHGLLEYLHSRHTR